MTTNQELTLPPDPLAEALRMKLRSLLDEPVTVKSLTEIEQTARLAKELIAVGKNPLVMAKRRPGAIFLNSPAVVDNDYPDDYPGALAESPKAETFGATVIREAISTFAEVLNRPKTVSPHELLLAIAMAKSHELPELAERLEGDLRAQLGGPVVATPVTPERVAEVMKEYLEPAPPNDTYAHVCTPADMREGGF